MFFIYFYFYFLLNVLGCHGLRKPYRFEVHNSVEHLRTALCTHVQSQVSFLPHLCPLCPLSSSHLLPFPSGYHHNIVCVYI